MRRQAATDNAVLAELVKRHSSALARIATAADYDSFCTSLHTGMRALADEDLDTLYAHRAPEPILPRATRLARRFASAAVLVGFSFVVPLLPGVTESAGQGARWMLLMTALLSVVPANDTTSGSVRAVLDKSLLRNGKP